MGRPSKSDDEKRLTGTLQKCRANREQLAVEGALPAAPPVGLTKEARAAWAMAISCAPEGLLTALDHSVLERWARNYALYRKLSRQVDEEGAVISNENGLTEHPAAKLMLKVQGLLGQCEKELGFTPSSRARVRIVKPEKTEGNPFLES